jgi:hypothetical protein
MTPRSSQVRHGPTPGWPTAQIKHPARIGSTAQTRCGRYQLDRPKGWQVRGVDVALSTVTT